MLLYNVGLVEKQDGPVVAQQHYFWCPGCKNPHAFTTGRSDGKRPCWSFNGDQNKPTFEPSLLCYGVKRCHLFLRNGRLEFLGDCEHELANQTVDVPKWNGFANGEEQ